jgi:hypothetical protein
MSVKGVSVEVFGYGLINDVIPIFLLSGRTVM